MTSELIERVARIIANAMGDNFSDAFKNKDRWTAKRGMSGGRFRDVNEPMQCDYLAAAQAAIAAMQANTAEQAAELAKFKALAETLAEALEPVERLEMWSSSAKDSDMVVTSMATVRKMREAYRQYKEARDDQ